MPRFGQSFRREKILTKDAQKDIEHELTSYFEDASEQSKLAQYLDANQQQELHALEREDQEDITAFLSLAREEDVPFTVGTDIEPVPHETAEEQLARSGPNALFVIDRYLDQHHLKTPEMMAFCTRRLIENPYGSELVLLQILRDKTLYEDAYEARGVISNACAALEAALTVELRHFPGEHLESIAHELIEIKSLVPTHHEEIERLLALTGSETAHAYFAHTKNTLLDPSAARDLLGERHQHELENDYDTDYDRDRYREDWYDDLHDDRDDYEDDHREYFSGTGLSVEIESHAEVREIFDEQGEPMTSDRPLVHASINFTPDGHRSYTPERRTEFLFIGYADFKNLFERIDAGEVPHIDVFEGSTNREMAKASLILGFRIMPQDEEGPTGRGSSYRVIGLQEDIRRRLTELEARKSKDTTPLLEKMKERIEKRQQQETARP
ncbi:MAG: hypothetical protein Q8P36_01525 [bacterium]|nr:hypothetical protein [bacterium]